MQYYDFPCVHNDSLIFICKGIKDIVYKNSPFFKTAAFLNIFKTRRSIWSPLLSHAKMMQCMTILYKLQQNNGDVW